MAERWTKLYTRETAAWRVLGKHGQNLALQIVRLKDEDERIPLCGLTAADAMCALLPRWAPEEVEAGLEELALRDVVRTGGDALVWRGFFVNTGSDKGLTDPVEAPRIEREIEEKDKIITPNGELIEEVLQAMGDALRELDPSKRNPRNSPENRKRIRRPVKECGATLEDWQAVIRRQLRSVKPNKEAWRYLALSTLGKPVNFQRLLDAVEPTESAPQRRKEWQDDDDVDRSRPVDASRISELAASIGGQKRFSIDA